MAMPHATEYVHVPVCLVSGETVEIKLLPGSRVSDLRLDQESCDDLAVLAVTY